MHDQWPLPSPSPSPSPLTLTPHAFTSDTSQPLSNTLSTSLTDSHMTYHGTNNAGYPKVANDRLSPIRHGSDWPFTGGSAPDEGGAHKSNIDVSSAGATYRASHYYNGNLTSAPFGSQCNSTYTASPVSPNSVLLCMHADGNAKHDHTPTLSPQFHQGHLEYQPFLLESDQAIDTDPYLITGSYNLQSQNVSSNVTTGTGGGEPLEKVACFYDDCTKTFSRLPDLDRHVLNVHNRVGHHCQVLNCSNNKGKGYCRPDKLKEHMWKKHGLVADLSYTKVVPSSSDMLE